MRLESINIGRAETIAHGNKSMTTGAPPAVPPFVGGWNQSQVKAPTRPRFSPTEIANPTRDFIPVDLTGLPRDDEVNFIFPPMARFT